MMGGGLATVPRQEPVDLPPPISMSSIQAALPSTSDLFDIHQVSAHTARSRKMFEEQRARDRSARLEKEEQEKIRLEQARKQAEEREREKAERKQAEAERKKREAQAAQERTQQAAAAEQEAKVKSKARVRAMVAAAGRKQERTAEGYVKCMIDAFDGNAKFADAFYLKGRKSAVDNQNKALAKALRFALKDSLMAWTKKAVTNTLTGTPNDEGFLVTLDKVLAIPDAGRCVVVIVLMLCRCVCALSDGCSSLIFFTDP